VQNAQVGVGINLEDALAKSLGQAPPTPIPTPGGGGGKLSQQVRQLLAQALQHFRAANQALKNGDLGTYQSEIKQAQAAIRDAKRLAASSGGTPSPSPSPSVSASASPSPSPSPS
jgi:hypothetical protein